MSRYKNLIIKIARKTFGFWEKLGFHLIPRHFYSPIPDISTLEEKLWDKRIEIPGIDFNEAYQKDIIFNISNSHRDDLINFLNNSNINKKNLFNNEGFSNVDSEILYYMIRYFKPKKIIEVGSGYSTAIMVKSILDNKKKDKSYGCDLLTIDPYPHVILDSLKDNHFLEIIPKKIQDLPLSLFNKLGQNDILFIDSSHVLKIGSDVQFEYLEIFPILNKGVIIHCHDIFIPSEYPKNWVKQEYRFWNEQYLLQSFLTYNNLFKVIWAGSYMHLKNPQLLKKSLVTYGGSVWPISFYFKRVSD